MLTTTASEKVSAEKQALLLADNALNREDEVKADLDHRFMQLLKDARDEADGAVDTVSNLKRELAAARNTTLEKQYLSQKADRELSDDLARLESQGERMHGLADERTSAREASMNAEQNLIKTEHEMRMEAAGKVKEDVITAKKVTRV